MDLKIPEPVIYFPAVIDFSTNQAYFPHVRAITYLGDRRPIEIQFISGSDGKKIITLLSSKLANLIAVEMFNHNMPEPKSDFNLRSINLTHDQRTVIVPVHIKEELHKILGKPIRKTVTIPFLLDNYARKHKLNFSKMLRQAIEKHMQKDHNH